MSNVERYREQIDACRPASDDLAQPDLAELAEAARNDRALAGEIGRSERFDRAVAAAMHDVAVPPGLLNRLLERCESSNSLASQAVAAANEIEPAVELPPAAAQVPVQAPSRFGSRRVWLAAAAVLLAAVAAGLLWPRPPVEVRQDALAEMARQWMSEVQPGNGWSNVTSLPASYPQAALSAKPKASKRFTTREGWSVTAYDVSQGGSQVMLFVVNAPRAKVAVSGTPFTKLPASQGRSMGAWQTQTYLYVLVIAPNNRFQLENFLRSPRHA